MVVEWLGKGFALEFLLCFLYTVISIAYFVASYIDRYSDNMGPTCDSKTETAGWCAGFWEGEYTYRLKFDTKRVMVSTKTIIWTSKIRDGLLY